MLERFLKQTTFSSQEDFMKNFRVEVPENFNFGYDVVDAWAEEQPDKKALLWIGKDKWKCSLFTLHCLIMWPNNVNCYNTLFSIW